MGSYSLYSFVFGLLELNIMFLKFVHVLCLSILLLSSIHCILSIYHGFFIYFYTNGNLGFFSDFFGYFE